MDSSRKNILLLLLLIFIIIVLKWTRHQQQIDCSFLVAKFIQFIHLLLCIFILLGPFLIKEKELLILYILIVSFVIFHWILSSDVCALTLLEQWVTGKTSDETFVGRLVKPIYNITNRHIMIITVALLLISIIRMMCCLQ